MFEWGFTLSDIRKIVHTFWEAALAYLIAVWTGIVNGGTLNWKAWLIGALAAGWSAVKNGALSDDSRIK